MRKIHLVGLLLMLCVQTSFAGDLFVKKDAVGELFLQTELMQKVASYKGRNLMARVAHLAGSPYVLKSPINVQQVEFLKPNGATLKKNEPFVKIKGPEVHHYYAAYLMKKALYQQAKTHFENSKKLYQRKSLSEKAWLDISNDYHNTKMAFDELQHFFEIVLAFDEEDESLTLVAPIDALLAYSWSNSLDTKMTIASFVPLSAIRLKINIPLTHAAMPRAFSTHSCQLALDYVESANSAIHRVAWTETATSQCGFSVGQVVSVVPIYSTDAYRVKQSSVFSWEGDNYIFIDDGDTFRGVKVALLTSQDHDYIIQSNVALSNKRVLITSVSAAQGVLQGLGQ